MSQQNGRQKASSVWIWATLVSIAAAVSVLLIWSGAREMATHGRADTISMIQFTIGVVSLMLVVKAIVDMSKMREELAKERVLGPVITIVQCLDCNTKMERTFKDGEYVGKLTGENCKNCGSSRVIVRLIYTKAPRSE